MTVSAESRMLGGVLRDVRHLILAGVAAVSTFDPIFVLRGGAIIAVLVASPDIRRFRPAAADYWAFVFAALTYLSLMWTVSHNLTTGVGQDQVALAALFIAVRITVNSRRALGIVGLGYLVGCAITLWLVLQDNTLARASLDFDAGVSYGLTNLNANYVSYAMAGGVAVAILIGQLRQSAAPLLVLAVVAIYAGIGLAGTRGALIAFVTTVAWAVLVPGKLRRIGLLVIYGLVAAIAAGIFFGFTDDLIRSNIRASVGRETGDLNGRLFLWPIARDAFDQYFWFGAGGGTFPAMNPRAIFAHNVLLDVGAGLGVLGIAVFLALIWTTLVSGTRGGDQRQRALLLGAVLCAISPPMLSGYWYQSPALWVTLALFSRMVLVTARDGSDLGREIDAGVGVAGVDEQGAARSKASAGQRQAEAPSSGAR